MDLGSSPRSGTFFPEFDYWYSQVAREMTFTTQMDNWQIVANVVSSNGKFPIICKTLYICSNVTIQAKLICVSFGLRKNIIVQ